MTILRSAQAIKLFEFLWTGWFNLIANVVSQLVEKILWNGHGSASGTAATVEDSGSPRNLEPFTQVCILCCNRTWIEKWNILQSI